MGGTADRRGGESPTAPLTATIIPIVDKTAVARFHHQFSPKSHATSELPEVTRFPRSEAVRHRTHGSVLDQATGQMHHLHDTPVTSIEPIPAMHPLQTVTKDRVQAF